MTRIGDNEDDRSMFVIGAEREGEVSAQKGSFAPNERVQRRECEEEGSDEQRTE